MSKENKQSLNLCVVCAEPAQTSSNYQGKTPKCLKHRPLKKPSNTWDRWANGNQYGSFNSDDD